MTAVYVRPAIQFRIVCEGTGRRHALHTWTCDMEADAYRHVGYLAAQKWTASAGCGRFHVEQATWTRLEPTEQAESG